MNASEREEPEQASLVTNACEVANHDKSDSAAVDTSTVKNGPQPMEEKNVEGIPETGMEQLAESEAKENGTVSSSGDAGELLGGDQIQAGKSVDEGTYVSIQDDGLEKSETGISHWPEHDKPKSIHDAPEIVEAEDEAKIQMGEEAGLEGSISDGDNDGMIFGSSEAAKQFIEELERGSGGNSFSGADTSLDQPQRVDGQIVTDSDDEVDTDEEGENKEQIKYQAAHHQVIASAIATKIAHDIDSENQVGCMLAGGSHYPYTCRPEDYFEAITRDREGYFFIDVQARGKYPNYALKKFERESFI